MIVVSHFSLAQFFPNRIVQVECLADSVSPFAQSVEKRKIAQQLCQAILVAGAASLSSRLWK